MIQGGSANQALAMVSADQETVIGNGTAGRPLRLGAALSFGFTADYVLDDDARVPIPGLPVVVDAAPPSFGIASVTSGSSGAGGRADAVAILIRVVEGGVVLRGAGVVVLDADLWDAVTGSTGGLASNANYYLGIDGGLTTSPPTDPGTFLARVGIALSSVAMLLTTPSDPLRN